MKIVFTYTKDDLNEATKLHAQRQPRTRRFIVGGIVIAFFLALFGGTLHSGYLITPPSHRTTASDQALNVLLIAIYPFLITLTAWLVFFRSTGRRFPTVPDELQHPQSVEITPVILTVADPVSHTQWDWIAFRNMLEGPTVFVLCLDASRILILPKHAFPTAADLDAFRTLAQSSIPTPGTFPVLPSDTRKPPAD